MGGGFFLFCFVSFLLYFPHLAQQLLGVAASWAAWDSPCPGMCARMVPMGYCCHPTWLCHPMGGGPFLPWQVVTDTHLPFQAGPASEFTRQGHEGEARLDLARAESGYLRCILAPLPAPSMSC